MRRRSVTPAEIAIVVAMAALALLATRTVWQEILRVGLSSEEQSHILLAPVVAVWLAWIRRARLRYCDMSPTIVGPFVIAAGWALSAYGFQSGFEIFWHFGALMIVGGAVVTCVGLTCIRRLLPSVLALLFVLPVPGRIRQSVAVPLQEITAKVGEWSMQIMGVPVTREGIALTINDNTVMVAEACNGMRMVSALALIAFAFVFSSPMRNSVRLLILLATPVLAILVNLVRMIPTVLLYGYSSVDVAKVFHDLSGWASLGFALGLLWSLLRFVQWLEIPITRVAVAAE